MKPILLIEDDHSLGYVLTEYLKMNQMQIIWAKSAEEGLELLDRYDFQLAILDIMLPKMNGFAFAQILTKDHPYIPFLFLSAKSLKVDQLKGYKLGAFDYITKPVDEELLVAKIKSLSRINESVREEMKESKYSIGQYVFYPEEQQLVLDKLIISLTARESELLYLLILSKNKLLPRKEALRKIWGSTDEFSRKSMDVFISSLRKYLSKDMSVKIKNVHGKGFILKC